jgi:hypothetical protein
MAAQVKPVKVLTDLLTKKQIIKKHGDEVLFNVSGSSIAGVVTGHVSSSLPLTASAIYTPDLNISSSATFEVQALQDLVDAPTGKYNVDAAIHKLDHAVKLSGITDAVRAEEAVNAYKRLRFQKTGSFDLEGYAEIKLPLYVDLYDGRTLTGIDPVTGQYTTPVFDGLDANGNPRTDIDGIAGAGADPNFESFPTSSKDFINLDVMVKDCEDETATWVNDILAVNLIVSGAANDELWVRMWAPELAGDGSNVKYRLLAVNEDPSLYIIR